MSSKNMNVYLKVYNLTNKTYNLNIIRHVIVCFHLIHFNYKFRQYLFNYKFRQYLFNYK